MSQQANLTNLTKPLLSEESEHIVSPSPMVFSTTKKPSDEEEYTPVGVKKHAKRPQLVDDYVTMIVKAATNPNQNVQTRVGRLNEIAAKLRGGFPRKNNQEFVGKWTPYLTRLAEASANQLVGIEKAKHGRNSDVGYIDGPDQKSLKDATVKDLVAQVGYETKT